MNRPEDEHSLDVDSQDNSDDFENENSYHYQDGQNKADASKHLKDENQLAYEDDIKRKEEQDLAEYSRNRGGNMGHDSGKGDWAGQPKAGLSNIFFNVQFLDGVP